MLLHVHAPTQEQRYLEVFKSNFFQQLFTTYVAIKWVAVVDY